MAEHNELGRRGEKMAQAYLKKKRYAIVETNWKLGDMEVDIIARSHNCLVFVEVKTRTSDTFMNPIEAVDARRKGRLCTAAKAYVKYHHWQGDIRMDIITIILNETRQEINHFENAFTPRARFY